MRFFRQRSFFVAIFLFWFFSSLPRFWFFLSDRPVADSFLIPIQTLLLGFLQDGILISALILFFQAVHPWFLRLPQAFLGFVHTGFVLVLSVTIAILMANVEFFRFFGSNSNSTHFSLFFGSNAIVSSLKDIFSPAKALLVVGVIPVFFFFLCKNIRGWYLADFFNRRWSFLLPVLFFFFGLLAHPLGRNNEPTLRNLESNYVLAFMNYLLHGDELNGKTTQPIQEILSGQPSEEWHRFDPKYPLVQATTHHLCQMGKWDSALCEQDADGDGVPLMRDCDDRNPQIYPGAIDRPGNGCDEDCSGIDADPPNIVFIHWEGVRSVNVGSIGYSDPVTPMFDAMSKKSRLFKNAYANGTQTRWSLTSVYNSILPRLSTKWVFKHNPDLNLLSFPQILGAFGYRTVYVHSGDTNYGQLKPRFLDWFDELYDRKNQPIAGMPSIGWGPRDKDLFDFSYKLLKDKSLQGPVYLSIATLSLHHPFYLPDSKHALYPHTTMENKYKNILHYSDEQLVTFVRKVLADKELKNTIFVIASDHGMNVGRPHATMAQSTLWEDLVWIPILLVGDKWNVNPGADDDVRQLADIGPTILDRLGIKIPNHFIGHSLLRPLPQGRAFFGNANGGISAGIRSGNDKFIFHFQRRQGQLFDISSDRSERANLAGRIENEEKVRNYVRMLLDVYIQNTVLIKENRIWNEEYSFLNKVRDPRSRDRKANRKN